jgi:transforming growth factor-beta-induced protein
METTMKRLFGTLGVTALAVSALMAVTACGDDSNGGGTATDTVTATVKTTPGLDTLRAALETAGLDVTLAGNGPFTVLAPTDAAFAALPEGALDALLADKEALTDVLLGHVVSGELTAATIAGRASVTTLAGTALQVEIVGSDVLIGGAKVTMTDVMASNGIIHVIDAVLLPPQEGPGNIVEVATAAGSFSTLLTAVTAAGLADTLAGPGPFTVFAPTDDAFDALPAGTLEAVLADKALLTKILTYHVVSGSVPASEVVTKSSVTTLAGLDLMVEVVGADVFIGGAKVTMTDVMASNGIIHVIDAVLLPPSEM